MTISTLTRSFSHSLSRPTLSTFTRSSLSHRPHSLSHPFSLSTRSFSAYPLPMQNYGIRRRPHFGIVIVPETSSYIIERFGRYHKTLTPGIHFLIPVVDRISYIQNLKEEAIPISNQTAITIDNVTINIDGVLYLRIIDPVRASYGVTDLYYSMIQLAQTTMRNELGKLTLDKTLSGREALNNDIVRSINLASESWGVTCLRYEIKDISPPLNVKAAMDRQAEAERKKRATVLDSEGMRESEINIAEGNRRAAILQAEGEAEAILVKAKASAASIELISNVIKEKEGMNAISIQIAEKYIQAFSNLAKSNNTMILNSNTNDVSSMVAQAVGIYENVTKTFASSSRNVLTSQTQNQK
jgi:regulator of protease activity HflC (stomatin/prohibitin superfamily)